MVRCNTPGEAPEVVEARKTWFVPGARSAIPGHEVGIVRTGAGHGSSMKSLGHGSSPKMAGTVTLHIVFLTTPSHTQLALSNGHGSFRGLGHESTPKIAGGYRW